jgi:acyl-CoA thioesterase FadM
VRVRFEYEIVRAGDGAKLASGYTMHASLDPLGKPRRLPQRVRDIFGYTQ